MAEQMASPENLSVSAAAQALGISEEDLLRLWKAGQYYLLVRESENMRFPAWQLNADRPGLRNFIREFKLANGGCWRMHGFALRANSHLGGLAPKDYLQTEGFDAPRFEQAVRYYLDPEQGAV
jgi:hypothetical protein